MKVTRVVRERHYKHYDIHDEVWDPESPGLKPKLMRRQAYSKSGDYIGNSVRAYRLVRLFGITDFEKPESNHCVCSIGFSPSAQKWYGWSQRAICGFGIGDVVKDGDCAAESGWIEEYLEQHPEADKSLAVGFTALTVEDAKRMAIAFAENVS